MLSLSGEPINITATFTTSSGVTLSQAEIDCGVSQFDWQQKIDQLPSPSPFYANEPGVPLTAPPAFLDLIPSGYTYSITCPGGTTSSATNDAFPFYYAVGAATADCMSLDSPLQHPNAATLRVFDSPGRSLFADRLPDIGMWFDARRNPERVKDLQERIKDRQILKEMWFQLRCVVPE